MKYLKAIFSLQGFTVFLLVLFSIQYIPVESREGASWLKVISMGICAAMIVLHPLKISKASIYTLSYFLLMLTACLLNPQTFRASTIIYTGLFLVLYCFYYEKVVISQVFSYDFFVQLLKGFLMAYFICLVIQQCFILVGIVEFPPINLCQVLDRGIGANSLSFEPSSAARTMAVLFLALLRMLELKYNRLPTVNEILLEAKWPTIGFLWSMITMGSGTAFVALAILSLLFVRKQYLFTLLPMIAILYYVAPMIDFEPLQRAYNAMNAAMTLDTNVVLKTDGSAATRISPIVNTFVNINFTDHYTWIGHGLDYISNTYKSIPEQMRHSMIGRIQEFGLPSFMVMQLLVYSCAIRHFFSIETLIWMFLCGMTFANVSYVWGVILIFTAVRYFQIESEKETLIIKND